MKKSLMALAVIGAVGASLPAAADTNLQIYGHLELSIDQVDNGLSGRAGVDPNEKAGNGKSNGHGPPPWAHGKGKPDDKGSESDDSPTTKPENPSSGPSTASTTAPSTASTTTTSTSTSTSSTTSTTAQP